MQTREEELKKVSGGVASSRTRGIVLEVGARHSLDVKDERLLQVPEPVVSSRSLLGAFYRCIDVRLVWVGGDARWLGKDTEPGTLGHTKDEFLSVKAAVAEMNSSAMGLVSKIRRQNNNTTSRRQQLYIQQGRDRVGPVIKEGGEKGGELQLRRGNLHLPRPISSHRSFFGCS